MTFTAGINSQSYFPAGFNPTDRFASFSSQGLVHVQGTTLIVPVGFTMDISGDRPDLIRVEGVLRPAGSPAAPQSLTFTQGGVQVAPGGLFNMHGASLTLRTGSSVAGGELRDVGTLTIADQADNNVVFTQTGGMTDINGSVRLGLATSSSSNPRGTLNMNGGTLSIGSSLLVGTASNTFFTSFAEGTFRQTAGTTTVASSVLVANNHSTTGSVELIGGTLNVTDDVTVATEMNADGILAISGGALKVTDDVTVGRSAGDSMGQLTQSGGDFSLDALTVHPGSRYDLTGGTLLIGNRFDLKGRLNFATGNASIVLDDEGILDWSLGTLLGDASNTHYSAGVNSESYFPAGFNPAIEFASFSSQGLVHVQGTTLVVPVGFTMDISSDRPDLIRVEGVLRPTGSPASPQSLTFTQGGVQVAPGGLFNLFNAHLALRANSSIVGGEIRNAGTLTIGDTTAQHYTFTQTGGVTDVNDSIHLGYATSLFNCSWHIEYERRHAVDR
jgi:hypothetical protein